MNEQASVLSEDKCIYQQNHILYTHGPFYSGPFISFLPLGVGKLLLQALNLKQKEHNLTVKTTVKRNKYLPSLPFRTWRCFQSYLASPCVSSRTQSKVLLNRAFREDTSNDHLLSLDSLRPPKKQTSGRWRCSREKKFKKMTSKVRFNRNNTLFNCYRVDQPLLIVNS